MNRPCAIPALERPWATHSRTARDIHHRVVARRSPSSPAAIDDPLIDAPLIPSGVRSI
ncbi:hypothetical protein [Streptomyces cyaneochromogenes]|uniref:hypothetical protein n=1 Tax=Streptomyces cyaneochromogenes TaxID=2496836 RepID=UPI00158ACF92|nr:hypothetical protein [Streptomyces cyaneochromogenes]